MHVGYLVALDDEVFKGADCNVSRQSGQVTGDHSESFESVHVLDPFWNFSDALSVDVDAVQVAEVQHLEWKSEEYLALERVEQLVALLD